MSQNVGQRCATSMVLIANILKQKGNIMTKNKYVYVLMGFNSKYSSTYISRVCSSMKKAELEKGYIENVMRDEPNVYWISKERVS